MSKDNRIMTILRNSNNNNNNENAKLTFRMLPYILYVCANFELFLNTKN